MRIFRPFYWLYTFSLLSGSFYFALIVPAYAIPLSITQNVQMSFGSLAIPSGAEIIVMDATGTITTGSEWVLAGPQAAAEFTVNGDAGLIDIFVSNVTTCDASVDMYNIGGTFGAAADPLASLEIAPVTGLQLDGGNGRNLELGATISFDETTPLGGCAISYDLQITYT